MAAAGGLRERKVNASRPAGTTTRAPGAAEAGLVRAWNEAAVRRGRGRASTIPSREAEIRISARSFSRSKVHRRRQSAEMVVDDLGPGRTAELLGGVTEQVDELTLFGEGDPGCGGRRRPMTPSTAPPASGESRVAGLVVERDCCRR